MATIFTIFSFINISSGAAHTAAASSAGTTVRVNTGAANTDTTGNAWSSATDFSAGSTYTTTMTIEGTGDQPLYRTERYGDFSFISVVTNGTYNVSLKFAEIYWKQTGKRIFNVSINGTQVLTNLDILTHVAPNTVLDETFPVTVKDGLVTIAFQSVADYAKVSSLEILPATSSANSPFVTGCGTALCLNGQPWRVKGATAYGEYANAASEVTLARQIDINTLELVEFDHRYHALSDVESDATWKQVDRFIAEARLSGLHVILNLSEYGQSLDASGYTATTVDWYPYLSFIARRVNTVTGQQYADDSTIAMVELWGEIPAPAYSSAGRGTTQQMADFFSRSLAQWKSLAPSILVSSGGFSYLNDPGSGIPWKAIMSDPNNASCDLEINSNADRNTSIPMVSQYCRSIGKPWFLSAWSSCWGSSNGSADLNHWPDDQAMAAHALDMYGIANGASPAAMSSVGNDFWNLANKAPVYNKSCDIGPQFPLEFAAVQRS